MLRPIRHKDNALSAQHRLFVAQHVDLRAKAAMGNYFGYDCPLTPSLLVST